MNDITLAMSPGEAAAFREMLWSLAQKQAAKYTAGERSSISLETMRELMRSMLMAIDAAGVTAGQSPEDALRRGTEILRQRTEAARELWQSVCLDPPEVRSRAYNDTLRSIGGFFKKYDVRYMAHLIPCGIDYQLCAPVPESLMGVDYILEYLRRISRENRILDRFAPDTVRRLLGAVSPDWPELISNLCEPVIINAAGLLIIGGDPFSLDITPERLSRLTDALYPMPDAGLQSALETAGRRLGVVLGLDGEDAAYAARAAAAARPRVSAALRRSGMEGIFPPLS